MGKRRSSVGSRSATVAAAEQHGPNTARSDVYACLLLALTTILAYWPALNGGLVWDDDGHLTKPALQSLHGLARIWFDLGATQQYYPLLHSAFWVEHQFWGDAVFGYHLTNVLLHALAACLVVAIVRRLELPGAWIAGFLFALHPVCVESVAWIAEEKNTLSAVFALGAVVVYLQFDRTREISRYVLATLLFVLALLSKTVVATLPAALLIVFWWKRGKIDGKRDVGPLTLWLALGAGAGLFTAWVEKIYIGAQGADFALTMTQRVLLAGRAVWFYAGKLIWPANLIFTYPHWNLDSSDWRQYLFPAGVVAATIACGLAAHRNRAPLAVLSIFLATLFPVLGFLNVYPFRYSYVADHFQYLASLAFIVPAASAIALLGLRIARLRIVVPVLLIAVFAILTWRQSATFADAETLYRDALSKNPASWMAHNSLGNVLVESGHIPEAIAEYNSALRLRPDLAEPHVSRGLALMRSDPPRIDEAISEYEAGLRIKPEWAEAHVNLGNALAHADGGMQDAIAQYDAALRLKPDLAEAHNSLGNALARTGRLQDAVVEYQAALRINPDYLEAHVNLGTTWTQIPGRLTDAIAQYREALRIQPDLEPVREALARLQSGQE